MPDTPLRYDLLLDAARDRGLASIPARPSGMAPVRAVHTEAYLDFLREAHARWRATPGSSPDVVPHLAPPRGQKRLPKAVSAQAGFFMAGGSCPIVEGTWEAAFAAAEVAIHAAALLMEGDRAAYGLCRPPGHHALADMAGGFCYLNNAAIAAQYLAAAGWRVAIIDIDAHHGNGTQDIFYERADVLFVSLHADPDDNYPFYAGYRDETGAGPGLGYNLNLPLSRGAGDDDYLAALDRGLEVIAAFDPAAIVVSLGFDAFDGDPMGSLRVTTHGFEAAGRRLAALDRPTVFIQEGGYAEAHLAANFTAFCDGYLGCPAAVRPADTA